MSDGDSYTVNNFGGGNIAVGKEAQAISFGDVQSHLQSFVAQGLLDDKQKKIIEEQVAVLQNGKALPEEKAKAKNILEQFTKGVDGANKLVVLIEKIAGWIP